MSGNNHYTTMEPPSSNGAGKEAGHGVGTGVGTAGFAVSLEGAGTRTTGVVRCDQPRALDVAACGGRKLESVPAGIMEEVLGRLGVIVG